jgi:hypothetical protein
MENKISKKRLSALVKSTEAKLENYFRIFFNRE